MRISTRLIIALLFSWAIYSAVDYVTVRNWNNNDSLIINVIETGVEKEIAPAYEGEENLEEDSDEFYPMTEQEITFSPVSDFDDTHEHKIKIVRLIGSGVDVKAGGRYLLVWDMFDDGTIQYSIADKFRVPSVIFFIVVVCFVLIAMTGRRGILALAGLIFSICILIFAMIPLITKGWRPVPLAMLSVFIISTVTIFFVVKHARYRLVALLGSLAGVTGGFIVAAVTVYFWQLTGLAGEGAALLASTLPNLNMTGIFLAAVLVGAIGAVLDVGISITASMSELVDYDNDIPLDRLLRAGLNVGTEVLGSMINTLILAYIGSALPMAILISNAGANFVGLLNDPYVGQEIVQSIAGTLGLLFTIPATAFFFVIQEGIKRRGE